MHVFFWLWSVKWTRVARWHIFGPKIPIWVNLEGFCSRRFWSILRPFDIFCGRFAYFMVIWYIFCRLGIFCNAKSGNPEVDVRNDKTLVEVEAMALRCIRPGLPDGLFSNPKSQFG
jgi:hypothetical protein